MIEAADGISIHSWLLYHPDDAQKRKVPTVIWFHGNAGNIGLRLPQAIQMFHHLKANVWMIEYRGYGDSDDKKPTETGLKLDAEAVWEYANNSKTLLHNTDPKRMFVFGQSLGGAVAFHLAHYSQSTSYPPLAGVFVENTFISIPDMVDHLMPYIAPLKMVVLRMYWNSGKIVPKINRPTLFLAGAKDTLVPHFHMLALHDRMKSSKVKSLVRLHVVKDGTHNETWMQGGREYWMAIQRFFDEVFAAENSSVASYGRTARVEKVRGDGPLIQRKASASSSSSMAKTSSSSGECADGLLRKDSVAVDLGGEDAAEMISSVGSFIGMAREASRNAGGSKGVGGAVAYKKKD
jgi:pimeloyl-ACP methyl ester carboxylesterase